ncbi:MAG: hypothetical protein ACREHG_09660 [Candidatus Saccharimonadales bacterium]
MDFIGPFVKSGGYDTVMTITDRSSGHVRILPTTSTATTAKQIAELFFTGWFPTFGIPMEIICDRDKIFMSKFWKTMFKLLKVDIKASTAYHPQTDGSSERTNKTVIQLLRNHVDRHQQGWEKALPLIEFQINNSMNTSTGKAPFELSLLYRPRIIPSIDPTSIGETNVPAAVDLVKTLKKTLDDAKDNLIAAKARQQLKLISITELRMHTLLGTL